jgi:uncharacterized protein YjbJ (UPF0337 family)
LRHEHRSLEAAALGTSRHAARFRSTELEKKPMDKNRIKGSAEQAKGKVKEVAGKATGDKKLSAEGKADKVSGKIRSAVGGLKDAVRGR